MAKNKKTVKQEQVFGLVLLLTAAFIVHIICAVAYKGYETDLNCFSWWADAVFQNGVSKFYSLEAFTDYPPGYMYILWVVGLIKKIFNIYDLDTAGIILIKMPAMICDIVIGYLIYKIACKYTKPNYALIFAAAYMFNPAVLINSASWGQVDSVFTLFVLLMCYFITEKKLPFAYFALAIGILIKPQTLIFTPVLIYGIIEQVFLNDFSVKRMFKELGLGLAAILTLVLLAAPFGFQDVLKQYVETLGQYEYASVNAYNLWAMLGFNWTSQTDTFLFMPFKTWGTLFIILTVAASAFYCFKNKESESKYYITGAMIVLGMFTLSVRMHERYMYPALALLLAACAVKRKWQYIAVYGALSFFHFLNVWHVLLYYDPSTYDGDDPMRYFISFLGVAAFVFFMIVVFKGINDKRALTADEKEAIAKAKAANKKGRSVAGKKSNNRGNSGVRYTSSGKKVYDNKAEGAKKGIKIIASDIPAKWTKLDFIALAVIVLIYSVVAFFNLGNMTAPQTEWSGTTDSVIQVDFGKTQDIGDMFVFLGSYENRKFKVEISNDGSYWEHKEYSSSEEEGENDAKAMNVGSVFYWNRQSFNFETRYLRLTAVDDKCSVMEIMFYDYNKNVITPVNAADYPTLFDEQDVFDGTPSYHNGTYFDEIYHARTAYEMIHHLYCYENTHPPLGKALIALGITIFGMVPFGWRFMGTLFGVLMLPAMYAMTKKLTKESWLSIVVTTIFAFDFMHFTQTRIATIDVFVTLFIILMYYFMLCYYKMSFYDTPLKKTYIPLLLSGICMGLGCASKWTGVYAGLGLAVIFFAVIIRRNLEYKTALRDPKGSSEGIEHKYIIDNYSIFTMKTLTFCIAAFIIIPGILYLLSYIPYWDGSDRGLVGQMLQSQKTMYDYHANLDATHPYQSAFYQWPTMVKPVLYYLESVGDGKTAAISALGNPLVWWVGIPAFIYMIYIWIKEKNRLAGFLVVGYLAQYLPWARVTRCTFLYHYFPSVPFIALMIGLAIANICKKKPKLKYAAFVYVALAIGLFVLFYPVIAGYPVDVSYGKYVKWLSTWAMIF